METSPRHASTERYKGAEGGGRQANVREIRGPVVGQLPGLDEVLKTRTHMDSDVGAGTGGIAGTAQNSAPLNMGENTTPLIAGKNREV